MNFDLICEVYSDVGSVRIMSEDMAFLIPNGYGDKVTRVFLDTSLSGLSDLYLSSDFKFYDSFEIFKKAWISMSDCDPKLTDSVFDFTIPGRYAAYRKDGNVYLSLSEKY